MPSSETLKNSKNYDDQSLKILNSFIHHLNTADNESYPKEASIDLKYTAELQRKRLRSKNAHIKTEYEFDKRNIRGVAWKLDKDTRYITRMPFYLLNTKSEYFVNERLKKRHKEEQTLYSQTIWLKDQKINASYCCPNCGAVSSTSKLIHGCPQCRTKFLMSDLFPKITNYYTLKKENYMAPLLPCVIIGILSASGISGYINYASIMENIASEDIFLKIALIFQLAMTALTGTVIGYILFVLFVILLFLSQALLSLPYLIQLIKTKRKLPEFMRKFEPNFSLDHFIGKLTSLVSIMVYSDDYSNCAVYCGEPMENRFKDIIDLRYYGYMNLSDAHVENGYAYLNMDIHMNTVYCKGSHISKKKDIFSLLLCKNVNAEIDYGFSIHKIECQNCAASFDATREKFCPYCHSPYHIQNYDWVVLKFDKK